MAPHAALRSWQHVCRSRRQERRWGVLAPQISSTLITLVLGVACAASATAPSAQLSPPGTETSATTPALVTINYAATTLGWNVVPTIIAQEKGFFAAEQLTVELNIVGQSATVCQQVLVRAVEIGLCSVNDTIQAIEAGGAPLVIVMQETLSALHNGLMVRPDLTSWADLRGKTIILGGPKDNTVYFFRVMARANGLRDDEYDMIYAGSSSARYAALKAGGADASLLTDPFDYQIEQEGFRRFDNLRPKYISPDNYTGNGPVVRRDWAQSHADVLVRYIRAMLAAIRWINDPANKEEMFAILAPRINLSRETFERSYQRAILIDREWSSDGRARPSAYEGVLKSLVELRVLQEPTPPPTKYFDMTYVERVHRELGR